MTGPRVLAFEAGGVACAVDPAEVERILPLGPLLPAPRAPEWLLGLVEVKGRVLSVVDVGRRLFPRAAIGSARFLLLGAFGGAPCALAVSDVSGIAPAAAGLPSAEASFPTEVLALLRGTVEVAGTRRVLLDVGAIVAGAAPEVEAAARGESPEGPREAHEAAPGSGAGR